MGGPYVYSVADLDKAVADEQERCARICVQEAERIERLPTLGDRRLEASNADRAETAYKLELAIRQPKEERYGGPRD